MGNLAAGYSLSGFLREYYAGKFSWRTGPIVPRTLTCQSTEVVRLSEWREVTKVLLCSWMKGFETENRPQTRRAR